MRSTTAIEEPATTIGMSAQVFEELGQSRGTSGSVIWDSRSEVWAIPARQALTFIALAVVVAAIIFLISKGIL